MKLSQILLTASCALYAFSFLSHLVSFNRPDRIWQRVSLVLMRVGFLAGTFYFLAETTEHEFILPIYHFSQAMAFFAWSLAFVYLVLLVRIQSESFGLILAPILFLFSLLACLSINLEAKPITVEFNAYFSMHIISAFFAYACFTISFAAGLLYLIQQHELKSKHAGRFYQKLPSLPALERLIFQPMVWGAGLLILAVVVGFLWSKSAFNEYWFSDPKTIVTVLSACVYTGILYLHYVSAFRGKRVIVFSLMAFGMILFSFLGMRFIDGSHNFMR